MVVEHVVPSLDPAYGGPARCVPQLVAALDRLGGTNWLRTHSDQMTGLPDLVHDNGVWIAAHHALATASLKNGVPRVVSPHGMLEPWALANRRWKKRVAWTLYQRRDLTTAAALHVTSEMEAENVGRLGLRRPLAVIPNGVDVPEALPERIRSGPRRALFLSRINPKKGLPLLVEAWARVRPADWELFVAGPDEGGHRALVEAHVRAAGLGGVVSFAGLVTDADKWALYRTADLFVLPTHSENFGLVVAEALGAGVPVLTTTGAPWRDLISHGCGWWADVSVEALSDALAQATQTSRVDLDAMGARGQALVRDRYGWDDAARQMKAVYEYVLGRADRPACVRLG